MSNFQEFVLDARGHLLKAQQRDLGQQKAKFQKLLEADRQAGPLIKAVFEGRLDANEAGVEIRKLVPDPQTKKELVDFYKAAIAVKPTPVDGANSEKEIRRKEINIARREKLLKAQTALQRGFRLLSDGIYAGDADAANDLAEAAIQGSRLLRAAEALHPDLFSRIAKGKPVWPVLATGETGWEKDAILRLANLGVGDDLVVYKARFRRARGCDENLPARRWAKAAVRTVEETQLRWLGLGFIIRDFGSSGAFADFCLKHGWDFRPNPKWLKKARTLRGFTQASKQQWAATIRDMIREQIPDFHLRDEWKNQRNAAKASGRDTKGVIQNRILDDICDALDSIAPSGRGTVYGNSTAEIPQPR